ncbi:Calx-beta domain-containing protein [Actinoplanes couchii]|uniref:Calx-beta domain-containing protein n=1 Tax=Actinoplanes couchii TaxID=403638 RepID=A0ABQ3X5D8_9ACTN|nr:Calx-beta domain-containing protein [Actinoplanes couchii]MDR6325975.1 hypothetical protein [Actinoplanes couchii]GID53672.1 hypothetical protein Aco03nite_020760 [Actinoplanes couchii]
MRHRPIQTAPPHERVSFTLWGRSRVRQVLATATAAAVGLIPAVMVANPAYANVDFLTISEAGNWEGSKLTFTLSYTGTGGAVFTLDTIAGTASGADPIASTDFNSTPSRTSVSFPGTASSSNNTVTVTVTTANDADTADETFSLRATDSLGNTKTGLGTIWAVANADYPTFAISPATTTVAETAATTSGVTTQKTVNVTATLTKVLPHPLWIPVATADGTSGTATNNAVSTGGELRDYTALPANAVITIPAYSFSGSIPVELYDDAVHEIASNQSFTVNATGTAPIPSTTPGTTDKSTISITDDDPVPVATLGDAPAVDEGGYLAFPLTLDRPSDDPNMTIKYATSDGVVQSGSNPATAGSDYTAITASSNPPNPAVIPAYSKSRTLSVLTLTDSVLEGPENVKASLLSAAPNAPVGVTLGKTTSGYGVINDTNSGPAITADTTADPGNDAINNSGSSFHEMDRDEAVRYIALSLPSSTGPWQLPLTVDYAFKDGTATNGVDYKGTAGSFTIPVGATSTTWSAKIPVTVVGDTILEGNETFQVLFTSSTKTISPSTKTIYLTENGEADANPTWTTNDISVAEGNSGATSAKVPVLLSGPAASDVTFSATFGSDGTATETGVNSGATAGDNDYDVPAVSTVTIKAGDKSGWLQIPINGDTTYERDEWLSVTFATTSTAVDSTPSAANLTKSRVQIVNDDAKPTVKLDEIDGTEGGTMRVSGTLVGVSQYPYTLGFATGPIGENPATVGVDYELPTNFATTTVNITRGQEKLTGNFAEIYLKPDDIDEPTETFGFTVKEVTPFLQGFTDVTGTYRINDDPADMPPAASVHDESIKEDEKSVDVHVDFAFDANTKSTTQTISIPWYTADGTAKAGEDYKASKGVITVKPGELEAKVNVELIDDNLAERDENFWVKLGTPLNPIGSPIKKAAGEVTIKSDETVKPVKPVLTVKGPAKGAGKVSFEGMAGPYATVDLWGAPLPTTDPTKFKWLAKTDADGKGWYEFKDWSVNQGYAFATMSDELVSVVKTVKLTQNPVLAVSSTKGKLTVSVTSNPKWAGQTVTVQWWDAKAKKWKNVATPGKTASNGVYKGTWSQKSGAKLKIRAEVGAAASMGINSGWSVEKWITIK